MQRGFTVRAECQSAFCPHPEKFDVPIGILGNDFWFPKMMPTSTEMNALCPLNVVSDYRRYLSEICIRPYAMQANRWRSAERLAGWSDFPFAEVYILRSGHVSLNRRYSYDSLLKLENVQHHNHGLHYRRPPPSKGCKPYAPLSLPLPPPMPPSLLLNPSETARHPLTIHTSNFGMATGRHRQDQGQADRSRRGVQEGQGDA